MLIFVDAHVHMHPCFPLGRFLDAASDNFAAAAERSSAGADWAAFLLLTESEGVDVFSQLKMNPVSSTVSGDSWRFSSTSEDMSIEANGPRGTRIFLVAGRQIVTSENLEVLSLGSDHPFEERKPIFQTIDRIMETGALAVLPWGPGKWFAERGKIVNDAIEHYAENLFLGDNGNRPVFWPAPGVFKSALSAGRKILPGSDPLPFPSEAGRAGCFGFTINGTISTSRPAGDLIAQLRSPKTMPEPYGALESPGRFLRNQIHMQLIKKGLKRK